MTYHGDPAAEGERAAKREAHTKKNEKRIARKVIDLAIEYGHLLEDDDLTRQGLIEALEEEGGHEWKESTALLGEVLNSYAYRKGE